MTSYITQSGGQVYAVVPGVPLIVGHGSIDGYSPVETSATYWTSGNRHYVTVKTRCLPGGAWWRSPGAGLRRRYVDRVAKDLGMRRIGRAEHVSGWTYQYEIG